MSAWQSQNSKKLIRHLAASSALTNRDFALDMVRAGIVLYGGQTPPPELWQDLRPLMSFFSRVFLLRDVPRGTSVSYSQTWHAERDTRLALIEAGYADGIMRLLSNRGSWLINGAEAPIVGRVCMDCCLVDVTDLPQVQVEHLVGLAHGAPQAFQSIHEIHLVCFMHVTIASTSLATSSHPRDGDKLAP